MTVNRIFLIGRLEADPGLPSEEKSFCTFKVITTESWKDKKTGERKESTEKFHIVTYGQQAKFASEYLKKGAQIYVEGRLHTHKWKGKDGHENTSTEVIADRIRALGSEKKEEPRQEAGHADDIPY